MGLTSEQARALQAKRATHYTQEQVDTALMALVAWGGQVAPATRYLKSEKGLKVSYQTLSSWREKHAIRYDDLREKFSGQMEAQLAHEFRDVARQAVEVEKLALAKATERLQKGEEADPSRAAANAARVAQSNTDKLLSLTGRPTQITETRNLGEILRSLTAKGVISVLELPAAPEDATERAEAAHGNA